MRRFGLLLTLPLLALVLFAQQGATLHELRHLHFGGQELGFELRADSGLLHNGHCPTCQAFALVAHPATAPAILFVAPAVLALHSPAPFYSVLTAPAPTPRSRGPPQLLV